MSNEQKLNTAAINLYGVYNQELARMHELLHLHMRLPQDPHMSNRYGQQMGSYQLPSHHDMHAFWGRIVEMQNILIAALQSHDPLIQEKVAELALTGNSNEVKEASDEIPF